MEESEQLTHSAADGTTYTVTILDGMDEAGEDLQTLHMNNSSNDLDQDVLDDSRAMETIDMNDETDEDVSSPPSPQTTCSTHVWRPLYVILAGAGRKPPPESGYVEFECPRCLFIASTQDAIDEHIDLEHPQVRASGARPPATFSECAECGKRYKRKYDLQAHVKAVHLGVKDQACPSPGCSYRAAEKGKVSKHYKLVHLKVREYECEHCDYRAQSKSALTSHVVAIHLKRKDYKCDYCEHRAAQRGQIITHMEAKHLKIKRFQCPQCDFRANAPSCIKEHVRVKHNHIRDHLCPECGYSSATDYQLKQHILKIHTNKKSRRTKPILIRGEVKLKAD